MLIYSIKPNKKAGQSDVFFSAGQFGNHTDKKIFVRLYLVHYIDIVKVYTPT